jgi:hypothetical protein
MKSLRELREFKLRVQHQNLTVRRFRAFDKTGLIDWDVPLSVGYNLQRSFVWTLEQKQELIWSVLLDRDISKISVISIAEGSNERLQIIDGKQRLNALLTFMDNDYYIDFDNGFSYFYEQLDPDYQLAISSLHLDVGTVYEDIDKPISDEDKINWFNRINFAGTPQDLTHQLKLKGFTK